MTAPSCRLWNHPASPDAPSVLSEGQTDRSNCQLHDLATNWPYPAYYWPLTISSPWRLETSPPDCLSKDCLPNNTLPHPFEPSRQSVNSPMGDGQAANLWAVFNTPFPNGFPLFVRSLFDSVFKRFFFNQLKVDVLISNSIPLASAALACRIQLNHVETRRRQSLIHWNILRGRIFNSSLIIVCPPRGPSNRDVLCRSDVVRCPRISRASSWKLS